MRSLFTCVRARVLHLSFCSETAGLRSTLAFASKDAGIHSEFRIISTIGPVRDDGCLAFISPKPQEASIVLDK